MAKNRLGAALLGLSLMAIGMPLAAAERDAAREAFAAMDSDGNKVISREEFELNKVTVIFRRAAGRGAKLRYEDTLMSRATFDAIDIDGDGLITPSDIRDAPLFKFESYDRNDDDVIDFEEFEGFLSHIGQRGTGGSSAR